MSELEARYAWSPVEPVTLAVLSAKRAKSRCEVIAVGRREPPPIAHNDKVATSLVRTFAAAYVAGGIDTIEERYGRLDILINNAGGGPPVAAAQAGLSSPENRLAQFAGTLCLPASPWFVGAGDSVGSIVSIASVGGARPSPGTAACGAAKAGLLNVTKSLAMEWGPKVRVGMIVGLVHNEAGVEHYGGEEGFKRVADMLPLKRMASQRCRQRGTTDVLRSSGLSPVPTWRSMVVEKSPSFCISLASRRKQIGDVQARSRMVGE